MLGGVDVARAEQDGEAEHGERDEQGEVAVRGLVSTGARFHMGEDGAERGGDRLELERDVRDRADDRDQRHGRCHGWVLAVARGDEIGDRGDVLGLGEPHHAQQQRPTQADQQDRADVDGEEVIAGA